MWQLIRKPRWIILFILAAGLGSLFVRLGFWQWHKYHARATQNAAVLAGQRAAPAPIASVLLPGSSDNGEAAFRRVTLVGHYDIAGDLVLYGRVRDAVPGNEMITPFVLEDGRVIIVNRGWIPFQNGHPDLTLSRPPSGTVELTGVLEPTEVSGTALPPGRLTQVAFIDLGELSSWFGHPLIPYWVHLQQQEPPQKEFPKTVPLPPPDSGPYFGYALQWWFFASVALLGYPYLVWRALRDTDEGAQQGMPAEDAPFNGENEEET